jgi:hypothetical protein
LFAESQILSLHCPLTPQTHHLLDAAAVDQLRDGVMVINTSRGALVDTAAVIDGLKRGKIGYLGLDVYEEEADLFFEDLSDQVVGDDVFARLLTFPNVLITGHQAFFTAEALANIAAVTLENVTALREWRARAPRDAAARLTTCVGPTPPGRPQPAPRATNAGSSPSAGPWPARRPACPGSGSSSSRGSSISSIRTPQIVPVIAEARGLSRAAREEVLEGRARGQWSASAVSSKSVSHSMTWCSSALLRPFFSTLVT